MSVIRMKNFADKELVTKQAELENLVIVCSEKKLELDTIKSAVEKFQRRYAAEVAQKRAELNRLNKLLVEVMEKKAGHGHDVKPKNYTIETPFVRDDGVGVDTGSVSHSFLDSKEAKKTYRKIASIIHPDKAKEGRSRPLRTQLMAALNEAYALQDIAGMLRIFDQWQESPESVAGEGTEAELVRTIRAIAKINKQISDIEIEISVILGSDVYKLLLQVAAAAGKGKDYFKDLSNAFDAQIQETKNKLFLKMYA